MRPIPSWCCIAVRLSSGAPHQQLLAAKGRYWQMYQLQLAGEELAASAREESLSA
ncbi:hypothetical protein LNP26_04590 [Klebsiella variicola subsp. variicola]|nr:hypothetical protein [Klebsiella variicola subsp. variicola]